MFCLYSQIFTKFRNLPHHFLIFRKVSSIYSECTNKIHAELYNLCNCATAHRWRNQAKLNLKLLYSLEMFPAAPQASSRKGNILKESHPFLMSSFLVPTPSLLINYVDTKAKCCHLKKLTCTCTLRQVFIIIFRLLDWRYSQSCWYF